MINLAITQAGPNANTVFPNNIQIDYVRVYQENSTSIDNKTLISSLNFEDNILTFDPLKVKSVRVMDINGRNLSLIKDNNKIYTNSLSSGVYIVEAIQINGIRKYHKILIN